MEALSVPHSASRQRKRTSETRSNEMLSRALSKKSRLEYLYRPPVDICFNGSLQAARDYAQMRNRWLIVNLQDNTDFKCQILNRDLWSSEKVRSILKEHFIFWQVAVDNSEGMRFQSFYNVQGFPFVCILDPTTGEQKISYTIDNQLEEEPFRKEILSFLTTSSNHLNTTVSRIIDGRIEKLTIGHNHILLFSFFLYLGCCPSNTKQNRLDWQSIAWRAKRSVRRRSNCLSHSKFTTRLGKLQLQQQRK